EPVMSESKGNVQAEPELFVQPVHKTGTFSWNLELYEHLGRCWLRWSTNAPFRAQNSKICLYANSFPSDPNHAVAWTWADSRSPNPYDTGKSWGTGWCAALTAQAPPNGPYVYFVQTPLTTEG